VGIDGSFLIYVFITLIGLVCLLTILTPRVVSEAIEKIKQAALGESTGPSSEAPSYEKTSFFQMTAGQKIVRWLKEHPLADGRFAFFIFALIPVQTLFAHNWLTLPMYVSRAFRGSPVGEYFELASNLNPLLIFLFVPIATALTFKRRIYNMMLLGTFVMAAPTFLLALGPSPFFLFGYLIIMTVGEAIWQPRFLQYAAEIAPEGKTGSYMGVAQLPWFLTKIVTALYSGYFLENYCPKEGALNTEYMWLVYGSIAMSTFVLLVVAKKWMTGRNSHYSMNPPPPA